MVEGHVLLVDPDVDFQRAVAAAAPAFGLELQATGDAAQAHELARANPPACVVLELVLGGGGGASDGLSLVSALRSDLVLSGIPIVLVTEESDVFVRLKALERGVDILLDKPIKPQLLLAQVRALAMMAGRIRDRAAVSSMLRRATADGESSALPGAPFLGDIAVMPPATALTILELDQRTGRLEVTAADADALWGGAVLTVDVASGLVTGGGLGPAALAPAEAIREALRARRGRFEFHTAPPRPAPPGLVPTTRLLWAAIDDAARSSAAPQTGLAPSAGSAAPGADVAPPSSSPPTPRKKPRPELLSTLVSSSDAAEEARQLLREDKGS